MPLSDQLDFGGEMESLFEAEFEEGRHEVASGNAPGAAPNAAEASLEPVADSPDSPEDLDPVEAVPLPAVDSAPEETSLGAEKLPACLEPWKSFYILRRGVLPCCYGHGPIAEMNEYRETWNSPTMQAIRKDLAEGRFHQYCIDSTACPIVRKSKHQENTLLEQPDTAPAGEPMTAVKHPERLATPSPSATPTRPSRSDLTPEGSRTPAGDGGVRELLKGVDRALFFESGIKTYRSIRDLFAGH